MNNLQKISDFSADQIPSAGFIRLPEVLGLIPVSKSTWWAGVKSGRFPKPVKLGCRVTAWRAQDIQTLIFTLSEVQANANVQSMVKGVAND